MLTENDVVKAVASYLTSRGYRVDKECSTIERGIDIDAFHSKNGKRLLIEAKGATSSKTGTSRFGKPFDRGQATVHVSRAFYSVVKLRQQHSNEDVRVAMAFPDNVHHRDLIDAIRLSLDLLDIEVYFVSEDLSVTTLSNAESRKPLN